jgi:hypothetical protein
MKYICDHNLKTESQLRSWSKDRKLVTLRIFFWAAGTAEQRSHTGLLKSILFRVLDAVPQLTHVVFTSEWKQSLVQISEGKPATVGTLSLSRLTTAFRALVGQNFVPLDLCIFIDGLDEYEGPNRDILEFMKIATSCPTSSIQRIKMCLSSRPLNAFEFFFDKHPRLRIQDHTRRDIARFVSDTINSSYIQSTGLQRRKTSIS